jgi:hypothetical protein
MGAPQIGGRVATGEQRMRVMAGMVFCASLLASAAWAGDPVGSYAVSGKNPDGSGAYTGTAAVTKTGDTYQVVWNIGSDRFVGTGVGNDEFFAVGYQSKQFNGLALYVAKDSNWDGIWTATGGRKIGTEVWTRK